MLDEGGSEPGCRHAVEEYGLCRALGLRSQPPLIEGARHERGHVGVHPPCPVEQHPAVRSDGHVLAEQVVERRHPDSRRVAPLQRLRQLPRVADKDDVACRTRHRERVGE